MTSSTIQRTKIWKWAAVGYLIALHLVLVGLVAKTDLIPKFKRNILNGSASSSAYVKNMLIYQAWVDGNVPDKSVVFLGDSITQGLAVAAVTPYSTNYGIGGATTTDLLYAMPSYQSLNRVAAIVLAIGINDLIHGRKEGLHGRYRKIVAALPRRTPLIWSSVMPTAKKHVNRTDIAEANRTIKKLCEARGNCVFVDTWTFLADKHGQTIQHHFLADGTHLNREGYTQWISALKEAIQQIPPPGPDEYR